MQQYPRNLKFAIIGNPNSGKTTLFNILTGLNFKTGNFPGVTVDKRTGTFKYNECDFTLIDLPGTYSLHPNSPEEAVNLNYFLDKKSTDYPDGILYVADSTNLHKQLLLFDQLKATHLPIILALNMTDSADKAGIKINVKELEKALRVPVIKISARTGQGIEKLIKQMCSWHLETENNYDEKQNHLQIPKDLSAEISKYTACNNPYLCLLAIEHHKFIRNDLLPKSLKESISKFLHEADYNPLERQIEETLNRFRIIEPVLDKSISKDFNHLDFSEKIDRFLTHRIAGPIIFMIITFIIFQAVFTVASYPMDWINASFMRLGEMLSKILPDMLWSRLLIEGVLSGINGVLVFVPQIAIMFFFIVLLEESGYMARVVYMFDGLMRIFGMNGRSLISLISSSACAIPAIMSTRTIKNRKQRLITIFVSPFMSCSARIPVYTMLLALLVPNIYIYNLINLQGLAFFSLYVLGAFFAFLIAFGMKYILKTEERGYLIISLPEYRVPHWRSVINEVFEKIGSFIRNAGKIIMIISIVLWISANYAPPGSFKELEKEFNLEYNGITKEKNNALLAAKKLERSYAGIFGKTIEPVIKPLGYDWKIGIALLTSFAAREVFVGTLATIYSVDSKKNESLIQKIREAKYIDTDKKVFSTATSLSLLVFYILAMQCMSTLAVVRKETDSWKWPVLQFAVMTGLAYLFSWTVYHLLS